MTQPRMGAGLLASCLILFAATVTAEAAPTVTQMLGFRPRQPGVEITTPSAQDQERCKVSLEKVGRASGWLLTDEKGDPLRRYMDTNGDNKIDVWSYYRNGVEVYREIDSNANDKADQYRWMHSSGARWGIDANEDGKIDGWKSISPEEVSQEALQAVARRDLGRLQALLLTEADIKALELPPAEANRIRDSVRKASARFQETVGKLSAHLDQIRWDHVEMPIPQCVPADGVNTRQDVIRYPGAMVYYHSADENHSGPVEAKALQLGEMIQVGSSWRLIDAPVPGSVVRDPDEEVPGRGIVMNEELAKHYTQLSVLDKGHPEPDAAPAAHREWNMKRAEVLEAMLAAAAKLDAKDVKPEDRDQWVKWLADCLGAAAQYSPPADRVAADRLGSLRDQTAKRHGPSHNLTAYVTYCELMGDYNGRMADPKTNQAELQKELADKLARFVQDFPRAENTPEALIQLGLIAELTNDEATSRKWYGMFLTNYPTHPQLAKIRGSLDRLEADGKEMVLTGPLLGGGNFDIKSARGKVVVVYYWASWNSQCAADLEKLKSLHATYGSKGLEVVCVNLDNTAAEARSFLQGKQAPTIHLHESGGLSGRLGEQYGIVVLPTLFIVGKDGKVLSHTEQMTTLEERIRKAL